MAEPNMTNSSVFDELSSRMNQQKRPDSGIHNSAELHHNEVEKQDDVMVGGEANRQEYRDDDSGQESSDQLDSSMNVSGNSNKKKGFLNNFKKMFKKKKPVSKPAEKSQNNKKKAKDKKLDDQFKALSQPDVLAEKPTPNSQQQQSLAFKRSNTEASMTPRREKPPRTFTVKARAVASNDQNEQDDTNIEKKNSLKDGAQQYIRSSLRKIKDKLPSKNGVEEIKDAPLDDAKLQSPKMSQRSVHSSADDVTMNLDDEFFSKTLSDVKQLSNAGPLTLSEIEMAAPKIQTGAAKDKIRIAPQNRRKPSRYRTGTSPAKPTRSSSVHSFNNDSSLGKIDEDQDNFSSARENRSSRLSSSLSRQESQNSNSNLNDERIDSRKMSDPVATAIGVLKRNSFSTVDDSEQLGKARTIPQRSLSSNSRENVNRPKPPVKPPRSTHTSRNSLNKEDSLNKDDSNSPLRGLSMGALNSEFFYSEDKNSEKRDSYGKAFGLSTTTNDDKPSLREIDQNIPVTYRLSKGELRNTRVDREQVTRSRDLSKNIEDISRNSKEDISSTSKEDISNRSKEDVSRRSNENLFSRSREDISRKSKEDISRISKEGISNNKQESSVNSGQEMIFSKNDNEFSMTAFALTSPPLQDEQPFQFSRSKSYSEKSNNDPNHSTSESNFRDRAQTNSASSKSHGYLNEAGNVTSPPPVKQRPSFSPRKLRKPVNGEKNAESENSHPEFSRISLKRVSKDFTNPSEEQRKTQETFNETVNETVNVPKPLEATNELNTSKENRGNIIDKEMADFNEQLSDMFKLPDLRSSDIIRHSSTKKSWTRNSSEVSESLTASSAETDKNEMELRRHSLKKVNPPVSDSIDEAKNSQESPIRLHRASIEVFESSNMEVGSSPVSHALDNNKAKESVINEQKTRPPRPLVSGRPTKDSFKFQSNDVIPRVIPRSKSVSAVREKNVDVSPIKDDDKPEGEPEWFKLARKKQKNDQDGDYTETADEPAKKEQKIEVNAKSPPPPVRPKVSPRPVVSPKPETASKPVISPRPNQTKSPPVASKSFKMSPMPVATAPTRTSKSFNARTDVAKNECMVCKKTAYTFEKLDVNGHVLHKNCAKCEECGRKLNVGSIFITMEKVYCSQHK